MKKLNNNGWGFVVFIMFLSILFLAIIMVVYTVNDFEESLNKNKDTSRNVESETYRKYEKAIEKFVTSKYKDNIIEYFNIDNLDINSAIQNQCDGYVLFNYDSNKYKAYLTCNNYKTVGFSDDLLN